MNETITSPVFGYTVTFLEEGKRDNKDHDLVRISMKPGGGNFRHFHMNFTELFTVESGTLNVESGGRHSELTPGDHLFIPKRRPHRFYNATDEDVVFTARMDPATRFPDVLRIAYGLARDGRTNKQGIPKNIMHTATLWRLDRTAAALAPPWMIAVVMAPCVVLSRLTGVERMLRKYLS
jgi:mannose-6-phosphate isomerase-like protein (cupin superfamily)